MKEDILISGLIKSEYGIKKGYITVDSDSGLIVDLKYGEEYRDEFNGESYSYDENFLILRGDFNCHSHPEQSLYTDLVDKEWNLATWCRNTIYKYTPTLKPEYVYFACCRAFSRMLTYGVTGVMVSFYCHNNMGNVFDREVIRAAKDTGIRLYLGRMNYDILTPEAYEAKKASQKCYFESVQEAEKNFVELLNEVGENTICVAPSVHSIHASTKDAIVNAINLGNRYDRYVQFHLSEDNGDVDLSLSWYGLRPIEFLVSLVENGEVENLKNVILSDCVWIDDKERQLIKEFEMKVVLNPRMNDRIKTGESNLEKLIEAGINPYLGTDGEASNDDLSITGEQSFLKHRYENISPNIIDSLGRLPLKFNEGYIGELLPGNYCDLKIIKDGSIEDVFVGGRKVLSKGVLVNMDMENDIEKPLRNVLKSLN